MTTVPALSDEAAINQYTATSSQTDFNFTYMIFATADIKVYVNGTLKTETTHYTVKKSSGASIGATDLPLDGGKVVFVSGLTLNDQVTLTRSIAIARLTGYSVAGAFRADVVNAEFTKGYAVSQQLRRDIERSIRLSAFDALGGTLTLPANRAGRLLAFDDSYNLVSPLEYDDIQAELTAILAITDEIVIVAGIDTEVTTLAGISANITTVAGISTAVSTVAGISGNVSTVAGISANVTTVAGIAAAVSNVSSISAAVSTVSGISASVSAVALVDDEVVTVAGIAAAVSTVSGISAAVSTVSGISANVTTVAGISANVATVAGISGNVTTVAGISANVTTVAGISANVTTVAGLSASIASVVTNMTSIQNAASFGFPTLASGDENKTLQINTSFNGYNAVKPLSRKNVLMNGDALIWQRGTSFSSIADNTVFADRWRYRKTGAMVHDVSRSTDVPTVAQAGRKIPYSIKIDCTTVDSSIAAGDFCFITQRVEGYRFSQMIAQKASVGTFWVKAPKTGVFCIAHNNSGNDRGHVSEYTINAANTWEKKTISVAASPSAGTWVYDNGIGIDFNVILAAGSTFHTTAGAWQTGVFLATSNQVNACDNTANDFYITEIQWEEGSQPTAFEALSFGDSLRDCMRFYEKSWDYATALGSAEEVMCPWGTVNAADTTLLTLSVDFKVAKRATPTMVVYDPATGDTGKFKEGATQRTVSSIQVGQNRVTRLYATGAMASGGYARFHYTADAEL